MTMDHAQETALWRVIGEIEGDVETLGERVSALNDRAIADLRRSLRGLCVLFCIVVFAAVWSLNDVPTRGSPGYIEFTISCPKQHETVCRVIAAEAERLAIEKFKAQSEVQP